MTKIKVTDKGWGLIGIDPDKVLRNKTVILLNSQ